LGPYTNGWFSGFDFGVLKINLLMDEGKGREHGSYGR